MAADPLTSRTVDDLMLEDAGFTTDDDPFADKPTRNTERDDKTTLSPRKRKREDENPFGGEVDEEVKITKQRKKIPKLDADRLLSDPGIPKMRKLFRDRDIKKKLRLKGKGHEFSDAARLLNYYQMWLDQLYPRAKFADALQLVEKAGHTKKMQMYRKSWIDEGKPGYVRSNDLQHAVDVEDGVSRDGPSAQAQAQTQDVPDQEVEEDPTAMFFADGNDDDEQDAGGPDDDELDALLAQDTTAPSKATSKRYVDAESEGEDDLDALLAQQFSHKRNAPLVVEDDDELAVLTEEHHANANKPRQTPEQQVQEDEEGDELDAILNEDTQTKPAEKTALALNDEVDGLHGDADDFDALLSNEAGTSEPELPSMTNDTSAPKAEAHSREHGLPGSEEVPELDSNVVSSSPIPNVRTDELDELMDEHDATVEKQKQADPELVEEFLSSSPIPNRDSQ